MKLSDIVAKITILEGLVAAWTGDKTKATTEAIASFSSELTLLKTSATAELQTATASLTAEQGKFSAVVTALNAACKAVGIESGDEAKISAMEPGAKITALQTTVSTTLAKLNVPAGAVPAPKAADTQVNAGGIKKLKKTEFDALAPSAKMEFMRLVNAGQAQVTTE